jgi:membrane fusion protein (multidrug efflux system)
MLLVAGGLMAIFFGMKPEQEKAVKKAEIVYVKAESVNYGEVISPVISTGRIASTDYVDIISEVSGVLLKPKVNLKKGQSFRKGDLIVSVFKEEAELALKGKKSRFMNAIAGVLPDFKIDFPQSYDRWRRFFDAIDMEKDIPEMPEVGSEQEKIYLAGRNILDTYYSIKSDEIRLEKHTIYAPFDGAYTDVYLEVGSVVNPGSRIAKIIRTNELEMEVPLNPAEAAKVKVGDVATAIDEDQNETWKGRVIRKAKFVDPNTQSIYIYVKLTPSANKPLYKGQYLKAEFGELNFKDVMQIPRNALFNSNEVFVVVDGKLVKRRVNIVKISETTALINGLEEGAQLVIEPLVSATENTPVQILEK